MATVLSPPTQVLGPALARYSGTRLGAHGPATRMHWHMPVPLHCASESGPLSSKQQQGWCVADLRGLERYLHACHERRARRGRRLGIPRPHRDFKFKLNLNLAECCQWKSESLAREPTASKGHVPCHLAASPALRAARRIGGHGPGVSCQCLLNRDVTVTVTGT